MGFYYPIFSYPIFQIVSESFSAFNVFNDFVIKKKNKVINIGDIVTIKNDDTVKKIKILKIPIRRGPFKEACTHYEVITPFILQKTKETKFLNKISYGRRPTKSNRRKLDKFTGRNF